ncbi:MAG: FtsX-like permease family protein [Bacteroidales bacterium]|nr:FtsX-like permease family protein [Clostridium sp.]MCM1203245.1 FtsX-like permease family protein [Bacteroidales bacterium]
MSKGMVKSTIREIKSSFGRYMAILLIVALGVGFFAGLKVAYETMLHTADNYLEDRKFFDFHLLSTLGFDEDAETMLADSAENAVVEGCKSVDILLEQEDGAELVIKTIERPSQVNVPQLTEGRMPENAGECLADEHLFNENDIGKTLMVASANDREDADKFSGKTYTIVGLVRSPLYILYQRGTTAIGDGTIDGYIYLEAEAFNLDYDTDIYVALDKEAAIYSDDYEELADSQEDTWKQLCAEQAEKRYNRIYAEAMEEIEDADRELQREKAKGKKELEDAGKTLSDGRQQIADGEGAVYQAKRTLSANEQTLLQKEEEYQTGRQTYEANLDAYNRGKTAYDQAATAYNTNYKKYEKQCAKYDTGKKKYDQSELQYAAAVEQYEENKDYLTAEQQAAKELELQQWRATLDGTKEELQRSEAQLSEAAADFRQTKKQLAAAKKELEKDAGLLAAVKEQLDQAAEQIEEGKKQLASARGLLGKKEQEIVKAKEEIEEGQEEYNRAKAEFDEKIPDAEKEIEEAKEKLSDMEKAETYVLGRGTNAGYSSFENDAKIIEGVAKVFPIFFFLVAALVCMTTMTRMMEEQRTQIGVLKALGYSNPAIIGKYITYSGSAAIIGAAVGFFAGTWAFSVVIWNAYKMMYDMGDMHYLFKADYAVISMLVALLCSAGTTFVSCYHELQEMAAALMRPKAPRAGKRVLLEMLPLVWNRLRFIDKVSVRNLFRYKKRLFMMIVGVSGCTALLVTGMGMRDSIALIADKQFGEILLYDLEAGIDEGEVQAEGIAETLLVSGKSADLQAGGQTKSVNLMVPEKKEDFGKFIDMHGEAGNAVDFPKDGEAVITQKIAENCNVGIGDRITLQNSDLKGGSVTVTGIYENYFNHYAVMTPATYVALFGEEPEYNEMLIRVEEGVDAHNVAAGLMKQDGVTMVSVSEDTEKQVGDMMKSLDYVVILVVVCAAMLAFIVIYNLNNINITERIREIATIKVLGFYREETNSYVFRENIVLTLLGSLLGVALGHYLHAFVMSQIKIEAIAFDVQVTGVSFAASVVLTLLFNQIVNFFMSKKLEGIDMAESLKSVE